MGGGLNVNMEICHILNPESVYIAIFPPDYLAWLVHLALFV